MPEKERRRRGRQEEAPALETEVDEQLEEGMESPVHELEDAYFGVRDRVSEMFGLPEDFFVHMRAMRRELLLAVRSLIDARIENLEEGESRREVGRHGHVRIE